MIWIYYFGEIKWFQIDEERYKDKDSNNQYADEDCYTIVSFHLFENKNGDDTKEEKDKFDVHHTIGE